MVNDDDDYDEDEDHLGGMCVKKKRINKVTSARVIVTKTYDT